jgi:adenine specific DNA methylase Mod
MQFQVTTIEFDFTEDNDILRGTDAEWQEYQQGVIDEVLASIWEAIDEDDLIEEITTATGWCIKSINYRHVLK